MTFCASYPGQGHVFRNGVKCECGELSDEAYRFACVVGDDALSLRFDWPEPAADEDES